MDLERELHEDWKRSQRIQRESAYYERKRYLEDPDGTIMAEEILGSYDSHNFYDENYYDYKDDYDFR